MVCAFSKEAYEKSDEELEDEIVNQSEEEDYDGSSEDIGEDDGNTIEGTEYVASHKIKKKKCSVLVHKSHFGH
jgi:hypothetical protein